MNHISNSKKNPSQSKSTSVNDLETHSIETAAIPLPRESTQSHSVPSSFPVSSPSARSSGISNHLDMLRGHTLTPTDGHSTTMNNQNSQHNNTSDDLSGSNSSKNKENATTETSVLDSNTNILSSTGRMILRKLSSSDNITDGNNSDGGSINEKQNFINNIFSKMSFSPSKSKSLMTLVPNESTMDIPSIDGVNIDLSNPLDRKSIPKVLITDPGLELVRVTHRKKIKRYFKIDLNRNILLWNNKSSSYLYIDKIRNIRTGDEAKNYREEFKVSSEFENLWITIIYHNHEKSNNIKALHLIATSKKDFDTFVKTIRNLVYFKSELNRNFGSNANAEILTAVHWNNSTGDDDGEPEDNKLAFDGVLKLANKLHIHVNETYLKELFRQVDEGDKRYLTFEEFKKFVGLLRSRSEVQEVFYHLCKDNNQGMTYEEFEHFLLVEQHETVTNKDIAKSIFNKFSNNRTHLNIGGFSDFIVSSYTSPLKKFKEDYSRPLNEYFIASSHNTYLLGRQVNGVSSIEGYVKALQRGCRCIEVDIWDGDGEPIVTHGHTFTSSISFRLVVETIRKYSFITSPYPVILSLEIRCNLQNQLIVVNILNDVLDGILLDHAILEKLPGLPSPEQLKHKILVKVKKNLNSENLQIVTDTMSSSDFSSFSSSSFSEDSLGLKATISNRSNSITSVSGKLMRKRSGKKVKIAPELSNLGIYMVGVKFRNFSLPESKVFNHVFSFSEKSLKKMLKDPVKSKAVLKHNHKFLMRVYPSIYRFNSENFNPLPFWEVGTQLVATNWQCYDLGQQLNEAMFSIGTNSGYVVKPVSQTIVKPKMKKFLYKSLLNYNVRQYINITIISAQQLPKPKDFKNDMFDPYVELEVYGSYASDVSISSKRVDVSGSYTLHSHLNNSEHKDDEFDTDLNHTFGEESDDEEYNTKTVDPDLARFNSMETYPSVSYKTPRALRNGFNPVWQQNCRATILSNENNLVFLRFVVKCSPSRSTPALSTAISTTSSVAMSQNNSKTGSNNGSGYNTTANVVSNLQSSNDALIGVYCCKLDYLKKGYRHLPLYDLQGEEYIFSTLFVHIDYGADSTNGEIASPSIK